MYFRHTPLARGAGEEVVAVRDAPVFKTTTGSTETAIPEIAECAAQIGEAIGFSFDDAESPATSEHLNVDGVWEYHFETNDRWGFVAGRPDEMVMTTYPGWNTLVIEPDHAAVFYAGTLVGIISPHGGRIGWYAPPLGGGSVPIADLEPAMLAAFRAECDAVADADTQQADFPRGGE
jgi:hypothetical protein